MPHGAALKPGASNTLTSLHPSANCGWMVRRLLFRRQSFRFVSLDMCLGILLSSLFSRSSCCSLAHLVISGGTYAMTLKCATSFSKLSQPQMLSGMRSMRFTLIHSSFRSFRSPTAGVRAVRAFSCTYSNCSFVQLAMDGVTAAHLKETIVKTSEVRLEDEITDCDCSPYDHVRVLIVVS